MSRKQLDLSIFTRFFEFFRRLLVVREKIVSAVRCPSSVVRGFLMSVVRCPLSAGKIFVRCPLSVVRRNFFCPLSVGRCP
uniref:Uncharacterized protein n=1 Tax=Caenorhabditis tropicalis TaxID=1561998 RepID=A0A1I7UMY9_9PELO